MCVWVGGKSVGWLVGWMVGWWVGEQHGIHLVAWLVWAGLVCGRWLFFVWVYVSCIYVIHPPTHPHILLYDYVFYFSFLVSNKPKIAPVRAIHSLKQPTFSTHLERREIFSPPLPLPSHIPTQKRTKITPPSLSPPLSFVTHHTKSTPTSSGDIFSPPRLMSSLMRPVSVR